VEARHEVRRLLHATALDARIGEQPLHRNVSEVVIPGVLRRFDAGDLLLAAYPRPITIINPQDALGASISQVARAA
jgi:hypothetical protein